MSYNPHLGLSHSGIIFLRAYRLVAVGVAEVMKSPPVYHARRNRQSHTGRANHEHPAKLGDSGANQSHAPIADGLLSAELKKCSSRATKRRSAGLTVRELYRDRPEAFELLLAHRVLADQIEAGAYHKLHSAFRRLKAKFKQRGGDLDELLPKGWVPATKPLNRELSTLQHWAPLLNSALNGWPTHLYLFMRAPGDLGDQIRAVSPFTGLGLLTKQIRAAHSRIKGGKIEC